MAPARPRRQADVAITGDRIAAVGKVSKINGRARDRCVGAFVAPGFIDVHTMTTGRSAYPIWRPRRAGVTTVITGNCGISLAPLSLRTHPRHRSTSRDHRRLRLSPDSSISSTRSTARHPRSSDAAALVGHSTARRHDDRARHRPRRRIARMQSAPWRRSARRRGDRLVDRALLCAGRRMRRPRMSSARQLLRPAGAVLHDAYCATRRACARSASTRAFMSDTAQVRRSFAPQDDRDAQFRTYRRPPAKSPRSIINQNRSRRVSLCRLLDGLRPERLETQRRPDHAVEGDAREAGRDSPTSSNEWVSARDAAHRLHSVGRDLLD